MNRLEEQGSVTLEKIREPVNKSPDFVHDAVIDAHSRSTSMTEDGIPQSFR